jgi:hypothetical protein
MDFNSGVVILYFIAAIVVGIYVLREIEGGAEDHVVKGKVGPSYWGVYQGNHVKESESMRTIEPPAPGHDVGTAVGSGMYARGRAVKSAR